MDETKNEYEVVNALTIGETAHEVGAVVELTEADAAPLVEKGDLKLKEEGEDE